MAEIYDIVWLTKKYIPEIMKLESTLPAKERWTRQQFEDVASTNGDRSLSGMVVITYDEHEKQKVVSYFCVETHKSRISVLKFVGFGATEPTNLMLDKLISKLSADKRKKLVFEVRESDLTFQKYLKSQGLTAKRVLKNYFEEIDEDAYVFEWDVRENALLTEEMCVS